MILFCSRCSPSTSGILYGFVACWINAANTRRKMNYVISKRNLKKAMNVNFFYNIVVKKSLSKWHHKCLVLVTYDAPRKSHRHSLHTWYELNQLPIFKLKTVISADKIFCFNSRKNTLSEIPITARNIRNKQNTRMTNMLNMKCNKRN